MSSPTNRQKNQGMSIRTKARLVFAAIVVLGIFFTFVAVPPTISTPWGNVQVPKVGPLGGWYTHLGLDLQGGTHLVYEADVSGVPDADRNSALEGARDVIERRVNALGVAEPLVQTTKRGDSHRLVIELAGITDVGQAIQVIGETPLLEFKEVAAPAAAPVEAEPTPDEKAAAEAEDTAKQTLAAELIGRIQKGESFEALAAQYSDDAANKNTGGDLGWVPRGIFTPTFERVIFDELKAGELRATPLKTEFGYHIIKKIEERTAENGALEVHSAHILLQPKSTVPAAPTDVQWSPTSLSGTHLKRAQVLFDPTSNLPQVGISFNADGAKLFEEITQRNIGKPVGIFLDGSLISAPNVETAISGGEAVISGNFSLGEAKVLVQRLNAGALPLPVHLVSQQTVDASLGADSLVQSLNAGLIGLLLVGLFMILYYRLPGLLAVTALLLYAIINMALINIIPVTLTLAGVAGFILSIGMAVDANVLIFERMKEELGRGSSYPEAIEEAFHRAWPSIRDSNISSLITCVILYWLGTPIIRGFAVTLGLGIFVSMFSAVTVSRTFLRLVGRWQFLQQRWLYGYKKQNNA